MNKTWKIGIVKDTSKPMLGLHGLHNAFRGLPGCETVAHVDSNPENIEQKMAYTGAKKHYLNYLEMLDNEKPDIAVLCSRHPGDHFEQIKAAAERGIHLYCEKPMTVSLKEADAIIELAETHHIKICMAHPARYAATFRTMKAMIDAGEIGTPLTVYGRGKCDHRGGGEDLIVLGTHILDLQTFFFGAPEYVWAEVTDAGRPIVKTDRTKTVEPLGPVAGDNIYAVFSFAGGIRGVFETRKGLYDYERGVNNMGISVAGTAGTLTMLFDDRGDRSLRISRSPAQPGGMDRFEDVLLREDRHIPGAAPLDYALCGQPDIPRASFFLEANRFAAWDLMRSIEEDRLPVSNQYNARLAQEMIYAIYASNLARKSIYFPLTDRKHPLDN